MTERLIETHEILTLHREQVFAETLLPNITLEDLLSTLECRHTKWRWNLEIVEGPFTRKYFNGIVRQTRTSCGVCNIKAKWMIGNIEFVVNQDDRFEKNVTKRTHGLYDSKVKTDPDVNVYDEHNLRCGYDVLGRTQETGGNACDC